MWLDFQYHKFITLYTITGKKKINKKFLIFYRIVIVLYFILWLNNSYTKYYNFILKLFIKKKNLASTSSLWVKAIFFLIQQGGNPIKQALVLEKRVCASLRASLIAIASPWRTDPLVRLRPISPIRWPPCVKLAESVAPIPGLPCVKLRAQQDNG